MIRVILTTRVQRLISGLNGIALGAFKRPGSVDVERYAPTIAAPDIRLRFRARLELDHIGHGEWSYGYEVC